MIDSKLFYDQAKTKKQVDIQYNVMESGEISNSYYIYSQEQYFEQWFRDNNLAISSAVDLFDTNVQITELHPPTQKEAIFKWAFKIPEMHTDVNERDAVNHLLKVFHPFTGKITHSSYKETSWLVEQPPRNKYLNLMTYYKSLVEYI